MLKVAFYLWKRPSMSREDFIGYYENHHAPFVLDNGELLEYRRNYPLWETARFSGGAFKDGVNFDVMTEMWVASPEVLMRNMQRAFSEPLKSAWEEDEAKFMDRSMLLKFTVLDEQPDAMPPPLGGQKLVRYIGTGAPGATLSHLVKCPAGARAHRSSLVLHGHPATMPGNDAVISSNIGRLNLARIDEIWFDHAAPPLSIDDDGPEIAVLVDEYSSFA